MTNNEIVVCFPQWGNYSAAFRYLFENGFDYIILTRKAIKEISYQEMEESLVSLLKERKKHEKI